MIKGTSMNIKPSHTGRLAYQIICLPNKFMVLGARTSARGKVYNIGEIEPA
jgi:hypothetical protein